jgi:hypothetical protein
VFDSQLDNILNLFVLEHTDEIIFNQVPNDFHGIISDYYIFRVADINKYCFQCLEQICDFGIVYYTEKIDKSFRNFRKEPRVSNLKIYEHGNRKYIK